MEDMLPRYTLYPYLQGPWQVSLDVRCKPAKGRQVISHVTEFELPSHRLSTALGDYYSSAVPHTV